MDGEKEYVPQMSMKEMKTAAARRYVPMGRHDLYETIDIGSPRVKQVQKERELARKKLTPGKIVDSLYDSFTVIAIGLVAAVCVLVFIAMVLGVDKVAVEKNFEIDQNRLHHKGMLAMPSCQYHLGIITQTELQKYPDARHVKRETCDEATMYTRQWAWIQKAKAILRAYGLDAELILDWGFRIFVYLPSLYTGWGLFKTILIGRG